jgi:hypothetical protein
MYVAAPAAARVMYCLGYYVLCVAAPAAVGSIALFLSGEETLGDAYEACFTAASKVRFA